MNKSINLNLAAITSRDVVYKQFPIVKVIHDDEGDWLFFDEKQVLDEESSIVVSLRELLDIDSSIRDILTLQNNKQAIRENRNSPWMIFDFFYEDE